MTFRMHLARRMPPQKEPVAAQARLNEVFCSKRRTNALFGERRRMDRVMHEPCAVIVPEVMIRVSRIKPNS